MREAHFVKKNKEKWKLFEDVLDKKQEINPTTLSDLYIDITDDLSYAAVSALFIGIIGMFL